MSATPPALPLSPDDYLDHLQADLAAISAVPHAGLDAPVANCPGWSADDVIDHLAGILEVTAHRIVTPPDAADAGTAPSEGTGTTASSPLQRFSAAAERVIDALDSTDPNSHRPNWSGDDRAFFYWRRLTHETLVHRWDIENAIGDGAPIDPTVAIDGLDELFRVILPASRARLGLPDDGTTVHFHATDPGAGDTLPSGEWTLTFGADALSVVAAHDKGDLAYRGRAADLLLFVWNRSTVGVDAFGDDDPTGWWAGHVTI